MGVIIVLENLGFKAAQRASFGGVQSFNVCSITVPRTSKGHDRKIMALFYSLILQQLHKNRDCFGAGGRGVRIEPAVAAAR